MRKRLGSAVAMLALLLAAPDASAQAVHLAVIVGLSGDPEHARLFDRWASTLVDAASGRLGVPKEHVHYLGERLKGAAGTAPSRVTGTSTREEIARTFRTIASAAGEQDIVFIVLIGHGSFDGRTARFNLPGPDMSPADFAPLLKGLHSRHVVFVNTASASGPFLAELAAPGRVIVTATRSGAERYATLFGGYFIDALAGDAADAADADKNRRVSVLEAFDAAKLGVARAYEQAGTMLTEHPLLDDTGGADGSPDPKPDGRNGRIAAVLSLGSTAAASAAPPDPKLRALYEARSDLERRVEGLKLMKPEMDPARYASELETLLTQLALKSREIREAEGRK